MYKLARWLYALGTDNEYKRFKIDLLLYFNEQPMRYIDQDRGIRESDEHYKKRVDGWFVARKMIDEFFGEVEYNKNETKK
jgi:hypothetical protein